MKPLTFLLSLFISVSAIGQKKVIVIDSIGKHIGRSIEVISRDTVYVYSWRGMGMPEIKAGMVATVMPPNKRINHYWIKF